MPIRRRRIPCIYASFLPKDYGRTLELFSDIVFHSVFPEKEIRKEKEVVIDEINSYKDSPSELIFDDFEELIYQGYPIGRNILGSEEAVKCLQREDILKFVERNYHPAGWWSALSEISLLNVWYV